MLFWIFVILLVVGIVGSVIYTKSDYYEDWPAYLLTIILTVAGVGLVVGTILLISNNTGIDGKIAYWNTKQEMLVYQLENDIYDNDNDLGKRDLIEDIVEYNTSLARKQANQDDFWIGIFIPDIYDQFEFIELE